MASLLDTEESISSNVTHLRLPDPALLEGTGAGVMGTVVPVFTPVALIGTAHTGQTSGRKQRGLGVWCGGVSVDQQPNG